MNIKHSLYVIHTTLIARAINSGRTYSCRVYKGDGSQSIIILPNFSLYSTGHTKYGYWHRKYDIYNNNKKN